MSPAGLIKHSPTAFQENDRGRRYVLVVTEFSPKRLDLSGIRAYRSTGPRNFFSRDSGQFYGQCRLSTTGTDGSYLRFDKHATLSLSPFEDVAVINRDVRGD